MKAGHWTCEDCGEEFTQDDEQVSDGPLVVCIDCAEQAEADRYADEEQREYDCDFANPGGNSALRAESPTNPRNLPCPNCKAPNRLTPKDRALGYQCDQCADQLERGGY